MTHPLHTSNARPTIRALITTFAVTTLASCAGSEAARTTTSPSTRAATAATTTTTAQTTSPTPDPRVLTVAHIDGSGGLDPATGWFADALAERSGGALIVEVGFECCGREADIEQVLLEKVRAGDVDLGWVGVRAFAQAGTAAFEPLITPMLVRSYAAEQAIVQSDVANGLLAQLEPLGLVGLGLLPGHLRYPISTGASLAEPSDWMGQEIYVFQSQIGSAAVSALGAEPRSVGFDARDQGLADGSIAGLDNTIRFHADRLDMFTHMVADVPMTTRMSALVAAPDLDLSANEQQWITEAVADVAARTADLGKFESQAVSDACTLGDPGYELAGPDGIAAFEAAFAPAEAELAADPGSAATLEALHELVAGIPAETPVTCEHLTALPDTSNVTLRTLIDAPAENPLLSGGDSTVAGTIPVTYSSGGLTISARLSMPAGSGPFPAVVLVQPFGGLERAPDRLVDAGYAVLETDLRGRGDSDPDPSQATDLEMGSTLDVVNAARALGGEPRVDSSRIALIGAGLGGLIAINAQVTAPDAVAAVVATNPSSIDVWQNIQYYFEPDDPTRAVIVEQRGTPDDNPELWADLSAATFLNRVDSSLLILQGAGDAGNEPSWSDTTAALYNAAGKSADVVTFDNADFALDPSWEDAIATVESFLAESM